MKYPNNRWIKLCGLMALALSMALVGCAGEDGKNGVDGEQGPTGPQGPDGPPGTATCMNCHTDTWDMDNYLLPFEAQYATSMHGTGETYLRRGDPCSRCHTTEGFQTYVDTDSSAEVSQSSRIGCFGCHAPHTNGNFDLRTTSAVTFDLGGGTYNKGNSNLCANCHQGRAPSPAVDSPNPITSSRWGAHRGPQANILSGQGCWEIGGTAYNSSHMHNTISNGCVNCHMADVPSSGMAGGHSWWIEYEYHGAGEVNSNGCVACHTSWDDATATEEVEDAKAEFEADLAALKELLVAQGWLNEDDSVNTTTPPVDPDDRGAVLNYNILREDRSGGVHNPTYAQAVLDAAIAHVQGKMLQ